MTSLNASVGSPAAKIYGQPLEHWPKNLFIPPDALAVMLESFEGPLDLLWYLIRHHRLDVRDIPMTALCEQYLVYIDALRKHTLELAAEYLLMAAWLVEIKARLLLPQPAAVAENEPEEDPRAALVARLLEYERFRRGAEALSSIPRMHRDFESVMVASAPTEALQPKIAVIQLHQAWGGLLERQTPPVRHVIERETVSLRDVMAAVVRELPISGEVVFGQQERPLGPWWVARHPIRLLSHSSSEQHKESYDEPAM